MNFAGAGRSRLKSIGCNDRRLNDIAPAIDCHSDFNVVKGNVKTKLNAPLRSQPAVRLSHSLVPARYDAMRCDAMRRKMRLIAVAHLV